MTFRRTIHRGRALRAAIAGLALFAGLAGPAAATSERRALDHYERLPRAERVAIEYDLIWAAGVTMVTNGTVGRDSLAAIRAFESGLRHGYPDGILDPRERRSLARRAARARERAGYRRLIDARSGIGLGLPLAYVSGPAPTRHGALYEGHGVRIETFALRQGLRETYRATRRRPGREVTYEVLRGDWFVVTGREGRRRFYTRAHASGGMLRAYTVTYDAQLRGALEPVIVAMSNDIDPFAAPAMREERQRRHAPPVHPAPAHPPGAGPYGAPPAHDAPGAELPRAPSYTGPGSIERDYEGPAAPTPSIPRAGRLPVDGASCAGAITVSPGDTLARIGRRCGVSVGALRAANGGLRPRDLQAGQTLVIPRAGAALPRAPEPQPPTATGPAGGYDPVLTVRPRAMSAGGTVAVAASGFPPGAAVEIGFGSGASDILTERVVVADRFGDVTLSLRLPDRIRPGGRVTLVAITDDAAHMAVAGPYTVGPAGG